LSSIKPQTKPSTATATVTPNIKDGAVLRSINTYINPYDKSTAHVTFSIKNNLQYTISDIKVLILVYDNTGTVVDYKEITYFNSYQKSNDGIKPFLAKTYFSDDFLWQLGNKFKMRILDFKINEDE
jgi:hypothetical protein